MHSDDPVEINFTYTDQVLSAAIEMVTELGTIEQKLALRSLLHNAIVLLDAKNPGLADANKQ